MTTLEDIRRAFGRAGVNRVLAKQLAPNDNSKNQIYLGPDLSALNQLPTKTVRAADDSKQPIMKAAVDLAWLRDDGISVPAPGSQLILYPQYPEVRLSGVLRGSSAAPRELIASRQSGRILLLGITTDGRVLARALAPTSPAAREFNRLLPSLEREGVFVVLRDRPDSRAELVRALHEVHLKGWINSRRLMADGSTGRCEAPQCGGYTLEAELGIRPNGFSEPDFLGWEVKQHQVASFGRKDDSKAITLLTPEPTGGLYKSGGVEAFIRRFGYPDRHVADRLNFGGRHFAGKPCAATGLRLELRGFDSAKSVISDAHGGLALVGMRDEVAALWPFDGLMQHWNRKHAKAVYVPSMMRANPRRQYSYGPEVRLAQGTDFNHLLKAFADGRVYYDPGIKLEGASSGAPKIKRRSQFRIASRDIPHLYNQVDRTRLR